MAVDGTLSKVGKHGFALCGQTLCGGFCRVLLPSVITHKVFGGHENSLFIGKGRGGILQDSDRFLRKFLDLGRYC